MKKFNRENLQRVAGILEGLKTFADEKQQEILFRAIDIIDVVLCDEPMESEDT